MSLPQHRSVSCPVHGVFLPRSELAAIPQDVATVAEQNAAQTEADNVAASENPVLMPDVIEAKEDLLSSAAEQGFVIEGIATAAAP